MAEAAARPAAPVDPTKPLSVLVAGSWGPDALMENPEGERVLAGLLAAGHQVTARLHPMTTRHHPELAPGLRERFDGLVVETDMRGRESLFTSDVMISDWSGASFDYAFGLGKPVVYVDMPRKINNDKYLDIGVEPVEVRLRSEIGGSVAREDVDKIGSAVEHAAKAPGQAS